MTPRKAPCPSHNAGSPARRGFRGDGARGTRTPDLLGAIQALSHLSYSPKGTSEKPVQTPTGV
jgi:hypothetical protein